MDGDVVDSGTRAMDAGEAKDAGEQRDADSADAAPEDPPNYAFLTSTRHVGDLGGLEGADGICNVRASEADLPGTYVAFLGTETTDAADRLAGARGWVRPDGYPFADRPEDIASGAVFYPMRVFETGEVPPTFGFPDDYRSVWTGTQSDGSASGTLCEGWTISDSAERGVTGDSTAGATRFMFGLSSSTCESRLPLYCFGIDHETQVEPHDEGRLAFVSRDLARADAGISGFDEICQAEADRSGLTGTFLAAVGLSNSHPSERFSLSGETWVRPDGVKIFEEAEDFELASPIAPISQTADGDDHLEVLVWTGAGSQDCGEWQSTDGFGTAGHSAFSGRLGFRTSSDCGESRRLYCLEY